MTLQRVRIERCEGHNSATQERCVRVASRSIRLRAGRAVHENALPPEFAIPVAVFAGGALGCLSPFPQHSARLSPSTQPRSSHSRLMVDSRSPVPLHTKADAPTSTDRCLISGSFIAENTTTLASGLSCLI